MSTNTNPSNGDTQQVVYLPTPKGTALEKQSIAAVSKLHTAIETFAALLDKADKIKEDFTFGVAAAEQVQQTKLQELDVAYNEAVAAHTTRMNALNDKYTQAEQRNADKITKVQKSTEDRIYEIQRDLKQQLDKLKDDYADEVKTATTATVKDMASAIKYVAVPAADYGSLKAKATRLENEKEALRATLTEEINKEVEWANRDVVSNLQIANRTKEQEITLLQTRIHQLETDLQRERDDKTAILNRTTEIVAAARPNIDLSTTETSSRRGK